MHALAKPEILIRPMSAEDIEPIARLERLCFVDPWPRASFLGEIGRPGGFSRVLTEAGVPAAYLVAWFVADEVHLANLAVAPAHRGKRFAKRMLRELIDESYARGSRHVVLEVRVSNEPAVRLYESFHFKPVAIRKNYYVRQREDALVMIRHLGVEGESEDDVDPF